MGPRRTSREYALEMLYQIELKDAFQSKEQWEVILTDYWIHKRIHFSEEIQDDLKEFSNQIVIGVITHQENLDQSISKYLDNWEISKISKIDKNIMRIGVYEMKFLEEIPSSVSINEAVEVAKKYGSVESDKFVNAVLDKINKMELI